MEYSRKLPDSIRLRPVFTDGDTRCYSITGRNYTNPYYIISHPETNRLMNSPEVVGYEVYECLLPATRRMLRYLKDQGKISSANILSILRGALNYPMEESCYREGIQVHDISFLSSERVFHDDELAGLEIKYSKLATVPDSTLVIGDIIASGDTLVHCLKFVTEYYRRHNVKLRNIVFFTIGAFRGMELMERLTEEYRRFWPEFEGFIGVYYGGAFNMYYDRGMTGIQVPLVDFYWKGGVVAPDYRRRTLEDTDALFEKCTIYDGGARRYEIRDHIREVSEYWEQMEERSGVIDFDAFLHDKLGYPTPISFEDWLAVNHYQDLDREEMEDLYEVEKKFLAHVKDSGMNLKDLSRRRLDEFRTALKDFYL